MRSDRANDIELGAHAISQFIFGKTFQDSYGMECMDQVYLALGSGSSTSIDVEEIQLACE